MVTNSARVERIVNIGGREDPPYGLDLKCPACNAPDGRRCPCSPAEMRGAAARADREPPLGPSLAGDAQARKAAPIADGLLGYFPHACAYVAYVSKVGNEQHNPGEPMHWAFDKSIGTGNEIARHLCEAGSPDTDGLLHTGKAAWRALELLERELLASNPALKPGKNVKGFERK